MSVDGRAIELVRESWLVEDRWWTAQPLRRRYWEAVTASGRNVVVFHDLTTGARGARGARAHSPQDWVSQGWVGPQDWVRQGWLGPQDWAPQGWFVQGP